MINIDNNPTFVNSTLKVTATEDIDLTKELASENTQETSIDQLLKETDESEKKE